MKIFDMFKSKKKLIEDINILQKDIVDLKDTISTLKTEATDVYKSTQRAFELIKLLKIDKNDEFWWKSNDFIRNVSDPNILAYAHTIREQAKFDWIKSHKSIKRSISFHGGCNGCTLPSLEGVGRCLGCRYSGVSWELPDLNNKTKN